MNNNIINAFHFEVEEAAEMVRWSSFSYVLKGSQLPVDFYAQRSNGQCI